MKAGMFLPAFTALLLISCSEKSDYPTPDSDFYIAPVALPKEPTDPVLVQARQTDDYRLRWHRDSMLKVYLQRDPTNSIWDRPATNAILLQAKIMVDEGTDQDLKDRNEWVQGAVRMGCNDPFIRYLQVKAKHPYIEWSDREAMQAYTRAAFAMEGSRYGEMQKFFAWFRASQSVKAAAGTNSQADINRFRHAAMKHLIQSAADPAVPDVDLSEAILEFMDAMVRNTGVFENLMAPHADVLFARDTAPILLARGEYLIRHAWAARGSGWAHTVTPKGWVQFSERLAEADKVLQRAWAMDTNDARIPTKMLTVCMGMGKPRPEMETWFSRAMTIDTNNYEAASIKSEYLQPKWHGSEKEVMDFGRECVNSKLWGAYVSLVMVDIHQSRSCTFEDKADQRRYWKNPAVWADVRPAFERFFAEYPDAVSYRHNYAKYAYWCEAWDDLNRQIPLLGRVNYAYFEGKAEFEKMLRLAEQHKKPNSSPKTSASTSASP